MVHVLLFTYGNLYCYGGNNPVRYTDPDGKFVVALPIPFPAVLPMPTAPSDTNKGGILGGGFVGNDTLKVGQTTTFPQLKFPSLTEILVAPALVPLLILFNIIGNDQAPGIDAIPEEDKDEIAQHSVDGGHGPGVNLDNPTEEGVKERINDILADPNTQVKVRKRDGAKLYMASDGTVLIHNPSAEDKGSIYYPRDSEEQWSNFK